MKRRSPEAGLFGGFSEGLHDGIAHIAPHEGMRVRDHGPHSATRIGIEALKTDIPLTEENFFLFHDRF